MILFWKISSSSTHSTLNCVPYGSARDALLLCTLQYRISFLLIRFNVRSFTETEIYIDAPHAGEQMSKRRSLRTKKKTKTSLTHVFVFSLISFFIPLFFLSDTNKLSGSSSDSGLRSVLCCTVPWCCGERAMHHSMNDMAI